MILGGLFPLVIWDIFMRHYGLHSGILNYNEREWLIVCFLLGCEFITTGLIFLVISCISPWTLMQFLWRDAWCFAEYATMARKLPCPWLTFEEYWDPIDFMMIACFTLGTFMILPQLWWGMTWRETFIAKTSIEFRKIINDYKTNINSICLIDYEDITEEEEEREISNIVKDHED